MHDIWITLLPPQSKDVQLMTPLHTAVCQSQPDLVHQLLKAGSDPRCLDEESSTPLHEAATIGDTKIGKLILDSCKTAIETQVLVEVSWNKRFKRENT